VPWPLDEHISGFPIPSDTAAIFNPALPRAPSRTHDHRGLGGEQPVGAAVREDEAVRPAAKASFAATIGGGDLSVTASSTTGTRRSVTVNVSASTFAYEPFSVRSWTKDDKVDGLTGDEHGI
jgi:hypothetical protein